MAEKGQTEANYNLGNTNEIDHKVGERKEEEKGRSKIGDVYVLKDFQNAIKYLEIYLKISTEVGDRAGEGKAYSDLGNAYESLGDFQKAIECHERQIGRASCRERV